MRRSTPFDFDAMFDRMSREFDQMGRGFEGGSSTRGRMPVDLADEGDAVTVTADLPGYERDDIHVSVSDDLLTVRAEREATAERDDEAYVHRERRAQSAHRTVRLPAAVDEESASATYRNGVLTVTLPKLDDEGDDSHSIDIE